MCVRSHGQEMSITPENQSAQQRVQPSGVQTSLMIDIRHRGHIFCPHQQVMTLQEWLKVFQCQKYYTQLQIIYVCVMEMCTSDPVHCPLLEHTAPAP